MDSLKYFFGGTTKAISDSDSEGYLVRFTTPNKPDLHQQYFSHRTEFLLDVNPVVGKMTLYNHGLHPEIKTIPTGEITSAEVRDDGIYVRKKDTFKQNFATYAKNRAGIQTLKPAKEFLEEFLAEVDEYEKMLLDLRAEGLLKFSSGALPQSVEFDDQTGEILKWQIIEGSETGTPAEPRKLTQIHTSKSLGLMGLPYLVPKGKGIYPSAFLQANQTDNGQPREHDAIEDSLRVSDGGGDLLNRSTDSRKDKSPMDKVKNEPVETKMEDDDDMDEKIRRMVADEVEKIAKQTAESGKMEGDDDEDEDMDKDKSVDVEALVKSALADYQKSIAEKEQAEKAKAEADKKQADDIKAIVDAQVKAVLEAQNGTYAREQAGAKSASKTSHISVAEPNLYRDLSASDMALGVKLYASKLGDMKRYVAPTLGHMFSDEYLKSMANKMAVEMENLKPIDARDRIAVLDRADMKSAFPFKANELNASDITNQGDEWATVWYDTNLWERAREDLQLFNLLSARGMRQVTVPQGAESVDVYLETGSGTVYTGSQSNHTDATGQPANVVDITPFSTDKINVPLSKHTLAYAITYELEERSIINVVQLVNNDMRVTLAEALEDGLINGDTTMTASTNINLNDGTPATTTYGQTPLYIWADGIRHAYLVDHTARKEDHSGANLSMTDYEDVLQLFDNQFRTRRGNMLFIIDTKTESATRKLPELLTQDTTGGRGTMFSGVIQPQFGVQIYTSGYMPRTGSAGTISSAGSGSGANTLGGIACVYAPFWQYSRQREILIETDRNIYAQSTGMVASVTHNFRRRGDNAAVGKYNMTVV